ncbi:hypothetical protein BIY37_02095 [Candidatus Brocadia sapporoensis]|uniref:Uncharacterized protein n=1 Tax=Candidatus Brocadia sapporoensis TaxID=392547 RepID=A0A1V6M2K9_9BACT|nr:hypothetical protein BIY37_02095 [Candidatus Brocadia sapporoensis]
MNFDFINNLKACKGIYPEINKYFKHRGKGNSFVFFNNSVFRKIPATFRLSPFIKDNAFARIKHTSESPLSRGDSCPPL